MKVSITQRIPIRLPTARAIANYAKSLGAHAAPIMDLDGRVDEMQVRDNGLMKGTIFGTADGGLGVWINSKTQVAVTDPVAAVDRCLDRE